MRIKEFKNKFVNEILKNNNNSILILKGFEFDENFVAIPKLIDDDILSISKKAKIKEYLLKSLTLTKNEKNYLIDFSQFIIIENNKLTGVLETLNRDLVLIDFDLFGQDYLTIIDNNKKNIIKEFESDIDNEISKAFSIIEETKNYLIYSYTEIELIKMKIYKFSDFLRENNLKVKTNDTLIVDFANINKFDLLGKLFLAADSLSSIKIVNNKIGFKISDLVFENFTNIGLLNTVTKQISGRTSFEVNVDFKSILQRIDKKYDFKDLEIYSNPDINNEIEQISQLKIIHEIYFNAKSANKNLEFRDTFVTSPTGSGKSVMFQLPAVQLAEELNLVTIVVSPLIALMNDQVSNIKKVTDLAVTINSDYTPTEIEDIKEKISKGEKSIVYISPEALLSNSDISNLVGKRKIGLLVIDEAHIVATWGKSFRPDYWYLGDFLRKLRKGEGNGFPIAAFTATATYGGEEDMAFDIMDSLNMTVEKPYIGKVVRSDIAFEITNNQSELDYLEEKNDKVLDRINNFAEKSKKTLVYFPFVSTINETYEDLTPETKTVTGKYFGNLDKLEKHESIDLFKSGEKTIILASKAFGMGVDINDIKNVYHYAPTGNLADYVQEIGRAARKPGLSGIAITDYFKEDFKYIKQLFGMSSIKNHEVINVAKKIKYLYKKENKKNLLISPEEFSHVFTVRADNSDEETDNKLKTTLLILKKDFEINKGFNRYSLIFKPRSMFTIGYFLIPDEHLEYFEKIKWTGFFKKTLLKESIAKINYETNITYSGDIYELDFRELWLTKFRDQSFAQFKRSFFLNELKGFDIKGKLIPKLSLFVKVSNKKDFRFVTEQMNDFLTKLENEMDHWKSISKHFSAKEFAKDFHSKVNHLVKTSTQTELLVDSVLNMLLKMEIKGENNFNVFRFMTINKKTEKYSLTNSTYKRRFAVLKSVMKKSFYTCLDEDQKLFIENNSLEQKGKMTKNPLLILVQIMELIDLTKYEIKAGDRPQYFIRINSATALNKVSDDSYQSKTVNNVRLRHDNSIKIMSYFFTKLNNDKDRWDLVEDYFLGKKINELIKEEI
jgi:ATP-dependent DNA helicase RecQ